MKNLRLIPPVFNLTLPDVFHFRSCSFQQHWLDCFLRSWAAPSGAMKGFIQFCFLTVVLSNKLKTGFDVQNQRHSLFTLFLASALLRHVLRNIFEVLSSEDAFPKRMSHSKTVEKLQSSSTHHLKPIFFKVCGLWRIFCHRNGKFFWHRVKPCL